MFLWWSFATSEVTKLGVSGLIQAYRSAAAEALARAVYRGT